MPRSNSALQPLAKRPVTVHNAYPGLKVDRRAIIRAIHILDAHLPSLRPSDGGESSLQAFDHELSLAFLTDPALARLHADFLDDPAPTDVITFAGDPGAGLAGEICVSIDAARRHAGGTGTRFSAELTLYLVHGWLHLAGHDDLAPGLKRRMRAAEARALGLLRSAGATPRFSLVSRGGLKGGFCPRQPGKARCVL
jgi:probable rRNA maturation factor